MAEKAVQKKAETPKAEINMGKWLSKGWDLVFGDIGPFLLITLIYLIIVIAASSTIIGEFVVLGPLTVGFYYILFEKMRGNPLQIGDIAKGFNFFVAAALSNILITVFVSLGLIFCIIPGIVIAAIYLFTPAFIVEGKLDFWAAMEASRKVVTQHIFEMSIFVFVLAILTLAGTLLCGVGLLITTPLCFAATAVAYDDLVGIDRPKTKTVRTKKAE